jgi:hypothetical protein
MRPPGPVTRSLPSLGKDLRRSGGPRCRVAAQPVCRLKGTGVGVTEPSTSDRRIAVAGPMTPMPHVDPAALRNERQFAERARCSGVRRGFEQASDSVEGLEHVMSVLAATSDGRFRQSSLVSSASTPVSRRASPRAYSAMVSSRWSATFQRSRERSKWPLAIGASDRVP